MLRPSSCDDAHACSVGCSASEAPIEPKPARIHLGSGTATSVIIARQRPPVVGARSPVLWLRNAVSEGPRVPLHVVRVDAQFIDFSSSLNLYGQGVQLVSQSTEPAAFRSHWVGADDGGHGTSLWKALAACVGQVDRYTRTTHGHVHTSGGFEPTSQTHAAGTSVTARVVSSGRARWLSRASAKTSRPAK
jgi:hypothetical protein